MSTISTILIAEDDADDRFLFQTAFEEKGYAEQLFFVDNGVEVMRFLEKRLGQENASQGESYIPNFIILDLNMPKKDGREVLAELKNHPAYAHIPVVIFSTTGNPQEMHRCYQLGAKAYITKPNTYASLLEVIGELSCYWGGNEPEKPYLS